MIQLIAEEATVFWYVTPYSLVKIHPLTGIAYSV
jgi:hypothetical protein